MTRDWPAALKVTAIDANTGKLTVFVRESGVPLVDAVSASSAVPGLCPIEHFNGRWWTDGGMVSAANARLADGYDHVIVIAPMPSGYGAMPGAVEDVAALRSHAQVVLIVPDDHSVEAIGPNPYDPERRAPVATAGRVQGAEVAPAVAAIW